MENSKSNSSEDNVMKLSVKNSVKHRIPWLMVGLMGGLMAAQIVGQFEKTLSGNLALASFIPLIVYISDAVGTQMEAFVIRDMAIHKSMHLIKYIFKQLAVTSLIGLILSLALIFFVGIIYRDMRLSLVISLSMFFAIISSVFTGLIMPMLFKKEKLDPANASGPVATIMQDLISITIYFLIASSIM